MYFSTKHYTLKVRCMKRLRKKIVMSNILDLDSSQIKIQPTSTLDFTATSLDSYSDTDLTYKQFFSNHMAKNVPCIIKCITENWNVNKWLENDKPNFQYLIESFGDASVPVADCKEKFYNAQKKETMSLQQFLEYWKTYIESGYSIKLPCLYLKDWHFTEEFPLENIYRVPEYFASDWLNEFFTSRKDVHDDYRFVYMGPKGSWTPLHADVFSSFSWSVNICGKKRWVFYPPGQEKFLLDKHGTLAYDVASPLLKDVTVFKNYDRLEQSFEIIQHSGDAIFVPSGWHHQVWNLEDTISINHNWVNGCNIEKMWTSIQGNLEAVKAEISDCSDMEDWHEHCQLMLNATYGLDYKQFYEFLQYIVRVRAHHLLENIPLDVYGNWYIDVNHIIFDLIQAKNVLVKLVSDTEFIKLIFFLENECEIRTLMSDLDSVLSRK